MKALYFLIPVASCLALVFLGLFIWANKNNQYDDLDTPANRMLLDDELLVVKNNIDIDKNKDKNIKQQKEKK